MMFPHLRTCLFLTAALLCPALYGISQTHADTTTDPAEFVAGENANTLNRFEKAAGWKLLFDGKSFAGWRGFNQDKVSDGWKIVNGAIVRTDRSGDIITDKEFDNFELQIEYKISTGGNSGIMFNVVEGDIGAPYTGPEVQINDNEKGHDPQKAGWLYQLYKPAKPAWMKQAEAEVGANLPSEVDATRPAGEWNHVLLRVCDSQCEVLMNGVSYYKFNLGSDEWNDRVAKSKFAKHEMFGKAKQGHICLQDHGNLVAFRNIKIREISPNADAPAPVDGKLSVKVVPAFGEITWDGWQPIDSEGKAIEFRPIVMTHAGDGSGRLFVATQDGTIEVIKPSDDPQQAKLFLDLRDRVRSFRAPGANEEGLLGLAFHPDYEKNGHFYVYYTSSKKDLTSVVSRFTVSKDDPDRALQDSEQVVMEIPQPFHNHNGGSIEFGPDGFLYIGLGDGGSGNDPLQNGLDMSTWLGKVLRIDIDQSEGDRHYGIPADNPFVDTVGAQPEIYAYGFRNPWRINFDSKTGALWVADVGQDYWEEVNLVTKGGNYGWSDVEGTFPFSDDEGQMPTSPIGPIWQYDHLVGKSITGGTVYRGTSVPSLEGVYVYADFVSGKLWGLKYNEESQILEWNKAIPSEKLTVLAFGEGEDGEVYFSIPTGSGQGIHKFASAD
ncbi:MAG: PQQ-dependent sugar dehydrogenase [Planctomycetaceae bacterium]|nr:PQQ-dependent sugar dehydrogenase [Planctomycetaceae bacterium]